MGRDYSVTNLEKHWEILLFHLCSVLALYNLTMEEPDPDVVMNLDENVLFEETNKVLSRGIAVTENSIVVEQAEAN